MLAIRIDRKTLCEMVDYLSDKIREDTAASVSQYSTKNEKNRATKYADTATRFIKILLQDEEDDE